MSSNPAKRIRVPYWAIVNIPNSSTVVVRAPTGYVFSDMSFSNLASSDVGVSFSKDREQRDFVTYSADDLANGQLPTSLDCFTNFVFLDNAQTPTFNNIESSQIQSIQLKNNSGFNALNVHVWGVYVKDVCVQV